MDYKSYRKRSMRIINSWSRYEKWSEEEKKKFIYIYLLLEKSTVDIRADPLTVLHELYVNDIFTIEDVEKLDDTKLAQITTFSGWKTKNGNNVNYRKPAHIQAIKKAIEIHKTIDKSLLKELGYY